MNKKIYISTYCVITSYGSILQSYALKKSLDKYGLSSLIISEKRSNDIKSIKYFSKISSWKSVIFNIIKAKNKRKVFKRFENNLSFINDNIDILQYNVYDDLTNNEFDANLFLAGSDQIFHPALCNPAFFLDFVPNGGKKISYAASMGSLDVPAEKEKDFARLLNNFDSLSFREKDAAEFAKKYTDKEIKVHIDPTFLLNATEWRKIEKEYPIKGKYILLYPIYWDETLNAKLKELHKRTGLPIVLISDAMGIYHQKTVRDAGVEQFLWLLDHAEYVITSSFHGAALSIKFNKKLSMVVNPKLPSRLNSLAETLDFPIVPIEQIDNFDFDYEKININIELEKERSITYLKEVLCDK